MHDRVWESCDDIFRGNAVLREGRKRVIRAVVLFNILCCTHYMNQTLMKLQSRVAQGQSLLQPIEWFKTVCHSIGAIVFRDHAVNKIHPQKLLGNHICETSGLSGISGIVRVKLPLGPSAAGAIPWLRGEWLVGLPIHRVGIAPKDADQSRWPRNQNWGDPSSCKNGVWFI